MFSKILNKLSATQSLSEPQGTTSPLPEDVPSLGSLLIDSTSLISNGTSSWLSDLYSIGTILQEKATEAMKQLEVTKGLHKGLDQSSLHLILKAVQSLSLNIPDAIDSLQFKFTFSGNEI